MVVAVCLLLDVYSTAKAKPVAASQPAFAKLGQGIDTIALTETSGRKILWQDFRGTPHLLFFGFTHCPVVCPVTVWELDSALAEIGSPAKDLKIIFITLDPQRDTPSILANYFSGFKGRVKPLTGADAEINKMAKAFEVTSEKVVTGKNEYTLDHTAMAFLIDANGKVVDTLAFGSSREIAVTRLKALLGLPK